jgi:hypothetical protein
MKKTDPINVAHLKIASNALKLLDYLIIQENEYFNLFEYFLTNSANLQSITNYKEEIEREIAEQGYIERLDDDENNYRDYFDKKEYEEYCKDPEWGIIDFDTWKSIRDNERVRLNEPDYNDEQLVSDEYNDNTSDTNKKEEKLNAFPNLVFPEKFEIKEYLERYQLMNSYMNKNEDFVINEYTSFNKMHSQYSILKRRKFYEIVNDIIGAANNLEKNIPLITNQNNTEENSHIIENSFYKIEEAYLKDIKTYSEKILMRIFKDHNSVYDGIL